MDNPELVNELFWENAEEGKDGCLIWQSMHNDDGVPLFFRGGAKDARVVAYELANGVLPEGGIESICGNIHCVNPEHMSSKYPSQERNYTFLPVDSITLNHDVQPREWLNEETLVEYTEDMRSGDDFPPVDVFFDGRLYWLADGYHRVQAAERANKSKIKVNVHDGDKRDAILFAVGSNWKHGLRRTNHDKRRAVMRLLKDEEWAKWSNAEIARRCRVDDKTVARYREELSSEFPKIESRLVQRGDSIYEMDVSNINRDNDSDPLELKPTEELSHHQRLILLCNHYKMTELEVIQHLVEREYEILYEGMRQANVEGIEDGES